MLQLIFQVIFWVLFVYGFLSLINDSINISKKYIIDENICLFMTVKNAENWIEEYIRNLSCENIYYKQLYIIDLDSEDDTKKILKKLEKEYFNIKILKKNEVKNFLEET